MSSKKYWSLFLCKSKEIVSGCPKSTKDSYVDKIVKRFNLEHGAKACTPLSLPRSEFDDKGYNSHDDATTSYFSI
jgi:hypothetical protein